MSCLEIEKIKRAKTKKIGKQIEYYQEIQSTHIYAKEIANQKESDGKVILAEVQTAGIGTKGRSWYAGVEKNIMMTIILHLDCEVGKLEGLTIKVAEGIQRAIKELYGYELRVKKPNDLMLKGKKICGILTEINSIGGTAKELILSLGFNVNEENFSEETRKIATSLKKEYKQEFEREEIICKVLEEIEKEIEG